MNLDDIDRKFWKKIAEEEKYKRYFKKKKILKYLYIKIFNKV
jgi:hypothetical protein